MRKPKGYTYSFKVVNEASGYGKPVPGVAFYHDNGDVIPLPDFMTTFEAILEAKKSDYEDEGETLNDKQQFNLVKYSLEFAEDVYFRGGECYVEAGMFSRRLPEREIEDEDED